MRKPCHRFINRSTAQWGHKTTKHAAQIEWIHTHTCLTTLCPGLPGWASARKVKSIWILLKQETVSGSGISWAICKCAPRSRQITTPAPHHSDFYRPDALPAAQPTVSKHWRDIKWIHQQQTEKSFHITHRKMSKEHARAWKLRFITLRCFWSRFAGSWMFWCFTDTEKAQAMTDSKKVQTAKLLLIILEKNQK